MLGGITDGHNWRVGQYINVIICLLIIDIYYQLWYDSCTTKVTVEKVKEGRKPFGYGDYKYTFTNACHEESGLQLNDKTAKIFLSTKGNKGPVSDRLIELLGYIEHPEKVPEKPLYRNIENEVTKVRMDPEGRHSYMLVEAKIMDARRYGREEGEKVGRESERKNMICKMLESTSKEEVSKLTGLSLEEIEELIK